MYSRLVTARLKRLRKNSFWVGPGFSPDTYARDPMAFKARTYPTVTFPQAVQTNLNWLLRIFRALILFSSVEGGI
jgi:hypothetical protein